MAALSIALLGAPGSGVQALAEALNEALFSSGYRAQAQILEHPPLPAPEATRFALVLLMGLPPATAMRAPPADRPAQNAARQAAPPVQAAADLSLRKALADAALAYQVVYGTPAERLAHALAAIEVLLPQAENRSGRHAADAIPGVPGGAMARPWAWLCDKCSDPACEHKLLTALLGQRAGSA